jgi:HAD superfamily hydrolase (TIGR01509 family)
MKLSWPKYIVFDMDGTLVDNYSFHIDAWLEICKKYNGPTTKEAVIADLHGTNFEICQKYFGPTPIERAEEIGEEKEAMYRSIYQNHIAPIDGLHQFLEAAQNKGVRMAVGTMGTRENAAFVIEHLDIQHFLDHWYSAESVSRGKPSPDIFLKCLQPWNQASLKKEQLWVVEDTSSGIQAGKRAGAQVIGLTSSKSEHELRNAGADFIAANFTELLKMMR